MRMVRGVLVVLVLALAGCGGSGSTSAPSMPSPVPQATASPAPFLVNGYVRDIAFRGLAGAGVEVLDGPQAGTLTIADAAGAFSLTGIFDASTRFRATKEGHVTATQSFNSIVTTQSIAFALDVLGGSVNIAGDYTLTFTADTSCADQLPAEVRTRTYAATVTSSAIPADHTHLRALLSGADLDVYYRTIAIYVSGDYVDFDLSDNFIEEEVAPDTYLAIGGVGAASVGTSGVAATISAPFRGLFDYCITKAEPVQAAVYSCVPAQAIAHAQCQSNNHRLILTRR